MKVTAEQIEARIVSQHFFTAGQGAAFAAVGKHDEPIPDALYDVTICVLVLDNGHKSVGVNTGAIDRSQFDPLKAREMARKDAFDQLWPLLGFELRERLYCAGEGRLTGDRVSDARKMIGAGAIGVSPEGVVDLGLDEAPAGPTGLRPDRGPEA